MATATELPPFLPRTVIEGCFTTLQESAFRLFGLHESDGDPYHQARPDPIFFNQADYFQERRRRVSNCDYSPVQTRSAIPERCKRARHSGPFGKFLALRAFSRTNHLIAAPCQTPGRKPGPNHPSVRVDAGSISERFDPAGNSLRRETHPLSIIEIAGRMDNSTNYPPLILRERVLTHFFFDDAKTLPFDLPSGFDQAGPVLCVIWRKLQHHLIFTSIFCPETKKSLIPYRRTFKDCTQLNLILSRHGNTAFRETKNGNNGRLKPYDLKEQQDLLYLNNSHLCAEFDRH